MRHCQCHAMSEGLKVIKTAMMCKKTLRLVGKHVHHLFTLTIEDDLTSHRRTKLSRVTEITKANGIYINCECNICLMRWDKFQLNIYKCLM